LGLVSDGGVHSHMDHLVALVEMAAAKGLDRVYIHAFMDGRDTPPQSGGDYLRHLQQELDRIGVGRIATITGRYYAMDRDKRWERVREAYDLLMHGKGKATGNVVAAIQESYDQGVTDEFMKPIVVVDEAGQPIGSLQEGDVVVFFNFRNDRARELTIVLTQQDMPEHGMKTIPLHYCTMTPYDATFKGLHVIYDKENVNNTMGEVVANAGLSQLRIAETEKYAHVTFFFSGGREAVFENENRILIASPKVATYDLQPEMSAYEVKDAVIRSITEDQPGFICLNFANGDMVGHTGVYESIEKAVKTVDECVGEVVAVARNNAYDVLIIADHGNADNAVNADGSPNTAHSLNPVPCILVTSDYGKIEEGILTDVAPTLLHLMGVERPEEMTGKVLVS
ncbi:MAG: 2,3-bisphosphoglycerate-independent phosphoglycerate mutase, partial [Bacteroidales bacterium]|nr:2,3-bisphosphoglycerate-independent phosphoglycerate mutase [Bacteroidales bacterium]